MGLEAVGTFLKTHQSFFATTHSNADGDALASVLALERLCRKLGRPCRVIIPDSSPDEAFSFLPGLDKVEGPEALAQGQVAEAALVVDVPNLERLGPIGKALPPWPKVANIDHHPSNTGFGGAVYVDEQASSSVELIYNLIGHLGVSLDRDFAVLIYTGIVFDTGRFSFSNTTARALAVASEMLRYGVEPQRISRALYYERPVESLRVLGQCLAEMELHLDGRVSLMTVPHGLYQIPSGETLDTEGFVDSALSAKGAEVACLLKEVEPGRVRVSLRSKGSCDVNAVARRFDGGGHSKAAGCTLSGSLDAVKARVLEALEQELDSVSKKA
jgi:phosphoesterase RecJ-like protein